MDDRQATRRRYLLGLGSVGAVGLAGCIAEDEQTTTGDGQTPTDTPAGTPTGTDEPDRPDFGGYLDSANNYSGTVVDARGQDQVVVEVGAKSGLAFDPAAVHVDNGATVVWEWTGKGGAHTVIAERGTFDSGKTTSSGTYRHTFSADGIHPYYCVPHKGSGMKGAVVVGDDYPTKDRGAETEPPAPEPPAVEYLDDANNYPGYVDARGFESVVVAVGADRGLSFGPAAIHVDAGTSVSWVWTGRGGAHNVVAEDESFGSGSLDSEEGTAFGYTFERTGLTRYYCLPHKGSGMKGAVLVGGDDLSEYAGTYDPKRTTT